MMLTAHHFDDDRFDRSKRIEWLRMDKIHIARVLVAGAGALGNEVVKDMVLSGFRDITVVDMDHIVPANLNRCVFFRTSDSREMMKSDVLASRAAELDDDAVITSKAMRIQDIKEWDFDVVLGCLDNISARLHLNSHCKYHNIPLVDGATDGFRGKVQVVLKDGPCMECTMNRSHMRLVDQRFSCTGEQHIFTPKLAAEITTTSVIAAIQVREALKIISGKEEHCIRNSMYYDGLSGETDILSSDIDRTCPNHGGIE